MEICSGCGRPKLSRGTVLDYENRRLMVDGSLIYLTPQESDLMSVFVADPCFTFTTPELADKLWGNKWPANIHSAVNILVGRLRHKLATTNLRIVTVPQHGYGLRQEIKMAIGAAVAWGASHLIPLIVKVT